MKVTVEGSGRHVHVSREDLDTLYGKGFELEIKKMLSQPGQYASEQKVEVIGPKGKLKLSILGPCRKVTQVELSLTDSRSIGLDCPVRESGDIVGSKGCTIVGPAGSIELAEGVIIAKRHIHFSPEDAAAAGISDRQIVKVRVAGPRALVFEEVVCRVDPTYATFMHIDYDEVNAGAMTAKDPTGEIII